MKKFLLFATVILTSISMLNAQQSNFKTNPVKPFKSISHHSELIPGAACDTINLDAANDWHAYYYTNDTLGYVFGVSDYSDFGYTIEEDANYFNASATSDNYISGGLAYFAFANSNVTADLDKEVYFKVYDNSGGAPGTLLGSDSLTLSQIHQDVLGGFLTEFLFSSPIKLPLSKKFYVSIDHSNLEWSAGGVHDSLAIVANGNGDATGAAYQFINSTGSGNAWYSVSDLYSASINLFVFPYLSSSPGGCGLLPVSILNFAGNIKNSEAYLSWSTATESNNKGFYIERSKDGQNFTSVGFVNGAGNSSQVRNYSYTDATIKDLNVSTTYYRLKQVDLDGKASYSKVLPLNLQNIIKWKLYPNPVKDVATVELSLDIASKVTAQIISRDGRIISNIDKGVLNEGTQIFSINTQSLAKGSYLIRLNVGDKIYSQPLIKQ